MSMHLVGPYMTTTNYKKRKQKGLTKRDREAKVEHDKWLRKQGVHPDQLAEKKAKNGNTVLNSIPDYTDGRRGLPTSDRIDSGGYKKDRQVYSGERQLLGVATMHKSNMVPIFADKKEDAKDIANMRRN